MSVVLFLRRSLGDILLEPACLALGQNCPIYTMPTWPNDQFRPGGTMPSGTDNTYAYSLDLRQPGMLSVVSQHTYR